MVADFYDRVSKCKHKRLTEHDAWGSCGTDFCGTWSESHCADCGVFIIECLCGDENGMSGWPARRWRAKWKKAA